MKNFGAALFLVFVAVIFNLSAVHSADLENGDYVVGVGVGFDFGALRGKVVRVRGGQVADFCSPQPELGSFFNDGAYQAGYFNVPREVLIDAQGRVVFLAYLGGTFDYVAQGGWGLWRCDSMGAAPTLLGAFGAHHPNYVHYPKPLGERDVRQAHGLHLKVRKGVDLNMATITTQQFYVFTVTDDCCSGTSPHDTVAYDVARGEWIVDNLVPPVPTAGYAMDMINANGYTFSTAGNAVRAFFEPVSLEFQVGEFIGGLAFQSLIDLTGAMINSTVLPDSDPGNCPAPIDGITNAAPFNESGGFNVMSGFYGLAWADGGLVLTSDSIAAHDAFLPNFSLTLLDYDPSNDRNDMFHQPYGGCVVVQAPKYTPWNNSFWDGAGRPRNVRQMTPNGTAGTQGDKIVTLAGSDVVTLADGLLEATGIDVFPGFIPPQAGVALFFQINSPIDALITAPDGRRIGVDPSTGQFVNDYGNGGFDSDTAEPRIYGIWNPAPGDYAVATKGTGTGGYTISAFGADLGAQSVAYASFAGNASAGSVSNHKLGVAASGGVTNKDANLALTGGAPSGPATVGSPLTYSVTVTNLGPATAETVGLRSAFDSAVTFVSAATTDGGKCGWADGGVSCRLKSMANGGAATITMTVIPTVPGRLRHRLALRTTAADPELGNNELVTTTAIK